MITCATRCYHEVMEIIVSDWVLRFIKSLDGSVQSDIYDLIELLREYGHELRSIVVHSIYAILLP